MPATTTTSRTGDETGVLFPQIDGRRSTSTTSRAVFAEATRAVAPEVAQAIESTRSWHKDYVPRMSDVEAISAASTKAALTVAADGLDALHRQLVMARAGQEVALGDALRTWTGQPFATATVDGTGARPVRLQVPYRGALLAGGDLRRQLDVGARSRSGREPGGFTPADEPVAATQKSKRRARG